MLRQALSIHVLVIEHLFALQTSLPAIIIASTKRKENALKLNTLLKIYTEYANMSAQITRKAGATSSSISILQHLMHMHIMHNCRFLNANFKPT